MNSNIVLSKHCSDNFLSKRVFGTCYKKLVANGGLYGGYNKYLKNLIKFILDKNYSKDDQRNLNDACKYFDNIKYINN